MCCLIVITWLLILSVCCYVRSQKKVEEKDRRRQHTDLESSGRGVFDVACTSPSRVPHEVMEMRDQDSASLNFVEGEKMIRQRFTPDVEAIFKDQQEKRREKNTDNVAHGTLFNDSHK